MKKFLTSAISVLIVLAVIAGAFVGCSKKDIKTTEINTSEPETSSSAENTTTDTSFTNEKTEKPAQEKYYIPNSYVNTATSSVYKLDWKNNNTLNIYVKGFDTESFKEADSDSDSNVYELKINDFGEIVSAKATYFGFDDNKETVDMSNSRAIKYDAKHHVSEVDELDENGKVLFIDKYSFNKDGKLVSRHWEFPDEKDYADTNFEYENGQIVKARTKYNTSITNESLDTLYKYEFNNNGHPSKVQYKLMCNGESELDWTNYQDYKYVEVTENQYNCYMNTLQYLFLSSVLDVD